MQNTTINNWPFKNYPIMFWMLQLGYTTLLTHFFKGTTAKYPRNMANWADKNKTTWLSWLLSTCFLLTSHFKIHTWSISLHPGNKRSLKEGWQICNKFALETGTLKKYNHPTWSKFDINLWVLATRLALGLLQGSAVLCGMLTVLSHH